MVLLLEEIKEFPWGFPPWPVQLTTERYVVNSNKDCFLLRQIIEAHA